MLENDFYLEKVIFSLFFLDDPIQKLFSLLFFLTSSHYGHRRHKFSAKCFKQYKGKYRNKVGEMRKMETEQERKQD